MSHLSTRREVFWLELKSSALTRLVVTSVPGGAWHLKHLFAPKATELPRNDCPAYCAGVVIIGPSPRCRRPLVAQPGPQRRIRMRGGRGSSRRSVANDDAARDLLQSRISQTA